MKTHAKSLSSLLAALACAAVISLTSGCFLVAVGAAGAAGAGTVAYIRGDLSVTLDQGYEAVANATERAVDQMHFAKISETRDATAAELVLRNAQDKRIDLKLTKQADQLVKLQIRVGTFGDETISRAILDRIRGNL